MPYGSPLVYGEKDMDILASYKTDEKQEKEGKWFDLGDAQLKIASAANGEYLTDLLSGIKNFDSLSKSEQENAVAESLARHILLDWKGIEENGKEVEYSVEKATEYLKLKHFQDEIFKVASNYKSFLDEEIYKEAEDLKKS